MAEQAATTAIQRIDSFVGLSGPYDISHHFDFEAARGVEEISPMKAACGYSREQFRHNSPGQKLKHALADFVHSTGSIHNQKNNNQNTRFVETPPLPPTTITTTLVEDLFPPLALIHGVEDETVPFTATGEVAQVLRSCGVTKCDEIYLADGIAHQDTVMHLMLGGPALEETIQWIQRMDRDNQSSSSSSSSASIRAKQEQQRKFVARSKM